MIIKKMALALALLPTATAAHAGTEFPLPHTCPVGGEKFTQNARVAWTEYGKRPDGKVYSNWKSPTPLVECPGNKLLIVGEYSKDDVEKLKPLIASAEYLDLRKTDSPYYGAAWLMKRIGREPKVVFAMVQRAAWESDGRPDRKQRYMREMVDQARSILSAEPPDSMTAWQIRWMMTNGLREIGQFDEALAAVDAAPLVKLDVAIPDKQLGEPPFIEEEFSPLPGLPKVKRKRENVTNSAAISEAKTRQFLFRSFATQRVLIAEHNSGSEPVTLVPEVEALRRCKWFADKLTASETAFCTRPELAAKLAAYRGGKDSNYD